MFHIPLHLKKQTQKHDCWKFQITHHVKIIYKFKICTKNCYKGWAPSRSRVFPWYLRPFSPGPWRPISGTPGHQVSIHTAIRRDEAASLLEGGRDDSMGRIPGISYRSLVVSTNQPTLKKPLKSTSRSFSLKIDRGNELKKIELPPKFTFRFTVYIQAECTYSIHRSNGKKVDVDS